MNDETAKDMIRAIDRLCNCLVAQEPLIAAQTEAIKAQTAAMEQRINAPVPKLAGSSLRRTK